jgi:hypothetical protein
MNNTDRPLNGEVAITIIDEGIAPRAVSKRYMAQAGGEPAKQGRVYHAII